MNPQPKTTPKDFFFHLTATVALYTAVTALINLCFSVINYLAPDNLSGYFYTNSVAWPISTLVILIPILYTVEWLVYKDFALMPEKKDIWIRRWRIFLTLFLTIALISGDLIVLINTYLNGEISSRFVFKVLAILVIAGTVFKYYFFSLNEKYKYSKLIRRGNAIFAIILVLAAIITGFIVVGSPAKQRAMRFDTQRVYDLQSIQSQVVSYWQQKSKLPTSIADLKDPLSYTTVPVDPETNEQYKYISKGQYSFSICGVFSLASEDTKGRGSSGYGKVYSIDMSYPTQMVAGSWDHKSGEVCFERTIDPEKYQPITR